MIRIQDILSLTEFHRNTKLHMARLQATGRPEVLTVNGKAKLVVQDAAAYQKLMERLEGPVEKIRDGDAPRGNYSSSSRSRKRE